MKRRHFIQNIATATAAVGLTTSTDLLGDSGKLPRELVVKTAGDGTGRSRNDPLGQRGPSLPPPYKPPCGNSSHDNLMHPETFLPFCRQCSKPPMSKEERELANMIGREMGKDFDNAIIEALAKTT